MPAADVLRSSALFRGFTETGVQIFAAIASERTYPAGTPLFVENMVGDGAILIGGGQVRLSARNAAGEDAPLGDVGPGTALGAISLVSQGPRMCSATALTEVTAAEIRQGDFQRLLAQKPQACLKLLMNVLGDVGQRLQDSRDLFRTLAARR